MAAQTRLISFRTARAPIAPCGGSGRVIIRDRVQAADSFQPGRSTRAVLRRTRGSGEIGLMGGEGDAAIEAGARPDLAGGALGERPLGLDIASWG